MKQSVHSTHDDPMIIPFDGDYSLELTVPG